MSSNGDRNMPLRILVAAPSQALRDELASTIEAFEGGELIENTEDPSRLAERVDKLRDGTHQVAPILVLDLAVDTGHEAMAQFKGDKTLRMVPVIGIVDGEDDATVDRSYRGHANACVPHGSTPAETAEAVEAALEIYRDFARLPPLPPA